MASPAIDEKAASASVIHLGAPNFAGQRTALTGESPLERLGAA